MKSQNASARKTASVSGEFSRFRSLSSAECAHCQAVSARPAIRPGMTNSSSRFTGNSFLQLNNFSFVETRATRQQVELFSRNFSPFARQFHDTELAMSRMLRNADSVIDFGPVELLKNAQMDHNHDEKVKARHFQTEPL
jgi:hypothetical protein